MLNTLTKSYFPNYKILNVNRLGIAKMVLGAF